MFQTKLEKSQSTGGLQKRVKRTQKTFKTNKIITLF